MKIQLLGLLLSFLVISCDGQVDEKPLYLQQSPPSLTPEVFAPNLISNPYEYEFGSVFNKDATAFYYGVDVDGKSEIRFSELDGDKWTAPQVLLQHEQYGFNDPFLSPDENRLYFISEQPVDSLAGKSNYDIWFVEKKGEDWSDPINTGANINTVGDEYYISFTQEGTMYFSSNRAALQSENTYNFDIYASRFVDGKFQAAVPLSDSINTQFYEADVFVDPKESFVIFCATRPDGMGEGDLYISFKKEDGTWTQSKNMGPTINTKGHELCPFVSHDGKYFFYTSNQDIYWVDAKVIEGLR
ncbi:MAG: hypothetical protein AAGI38_22790 [Bacteroidota bacterium]